MVRYRQGMRALRPPRTARLLLALACCLALLAPAGTAARAAAVAVAGTSMVAAPAGLGQTLLRGPALGPLVAPGGKRDDREPPGPELAFVVAAALAILWAWSAAARRTDRPARRAAAAAGARAPPLRPAPR
jgi:hypothetical protein